MVNIVQKEIILSDKLYPITAMEVWWHVQEVGLVTTLEHLGKILLESSDPVKFAPVTVAVCREAGDLKMYEIVQ